MSWKFSKREKFGILPVFKVANVEKEIREITTQLFSGKIKMSWKIGTFGRKFRFKYFGHFSILKILKKFTKKNLQNSKLTFQFDGFDGKTAHFENS